MEIELSKKTFIVIMSAFLIVALLVMMILSLLLRKSVKAGAASGQYKKIKVYNIISALVFLSGALAPFIKSIVQGIVTYVGVLLFTVYIIYELNKS